MTTYFTVSDAKLVEASGEDFKTIVKSGTLTITGPSPAITVDGNPIPLQKSSREPFKRVGRDFKFATQDVMSFYYVSLPAGLDDSVCDRFEELLTLSEEGRPLTLPGPAERAAVAAKAASAAVASKASEVAAAVEAKADDASAGVHSALGAKAGGAAGLFGALRGLGQKAAEDTLAVANATKARAQRDIAALQESRAKRHAGRQGA
ncbi:hypothetical protein MNEG_13955 [Monoraphidium neglectum]|uniref:Uncharacterized protein n=1 Tax=Monoraphidium neglectum TaxID=145388 RepID=A0A0D2J1X9_9CHLO|nr:hypothetical protein MNEG_13955 [Monoraphidium neglectum]KIY94007.1 hypothetical protein MNEG_13955 [Monoraphidium neglectum]|eukprot:XP_013893027.1 hypothetical protein MNEG_13955 [Monoraphidium neglectum]